MTRNRANSTVMRVLAMCFALCAGACLHPTERVDAEESDGSGSPRQDIIVCGERFPTGVPVVLWTDPGGLNAYHPGPVYAKDGPSGLRYTPGRSWAEA
ncbi:MAG: hypothetical protein FJ191_14270, partial [Gammaproteobacteria bacterium]|nr:hypothetical protein [Gammaproteobacteria bacterium]